jgi:hypothetical protein
MRIWFSCIAVTIGLLVVMAFPPYAAANDNRLIVIESPGTQLSKAAREHLHKAITEVVERHGIAIVPPTTLSGKLLRCDFPSCLPQIAAVSGATYVLRVFAKYASESFKLSVELWHSEEGKLLASEGRDCPICDEQDLWGSAALVTQGVLNRSLNSPEKAGLVPAPHPGPFAQPPVPTPATQIVSQRPGKLVEYTGFALVLSGLCGVAFGVYYLSVDGDSACFMCDKVRNTRKYGLPLTIAGGVALVGGAGLLAWRFWPASTMVSIGPAGLSVAGRFQ